MKKSLPAVLAFLFFTTGATKVASPPHYDVLIQAGHEGRPADCKSNGGPETESLCHNTGSPVPPGEIVWTPIVADEATRILRNAGVSVLRRPAYIGETRDVRVAVYVHFDGSSTPCSSGASVAYPPDSAKDKALADSWKSLYETYWHYRFMPDDFTQTEREYYAYRHVNASDGQFLVEGGEMSCPRQYAWMKPRLKWLGGLLAYFISERIGKGDVPPPKPLLQPRD